MKLKYIFLFLLFFSFQLKAQFIPSKINNEAFPFSNLQLQFNEWKSIRDVKKEKGWKFYKRWEYEQLLHTMPDGEPSNAQLYLSEILKATNDKQASFKTSTQGVWTSLGPDQLPPSPNPYQQHGMGRINCMAFHPNDPNTYWIGVAQGGIWKTTDNGSSWISISDQLPILRISDIVVDPNNTDIMYVSLCDFEYIDFGLLLYGRKRHTYFGMGVYKTTDGGLSWNPTGLSFTIQDEEASLIRKIVINPNNSNELVAAGVSGIYTSSDAGTSWIQVLDSICWDLVQDPSTATTLYAATAYLENAQIGYASILKSTDFGKSWIQLNTGIPPIGAVQRIKIAVAPSDPNYVYAICTDLEGGLYGIYKSMDAGNSWLLQYNALNIMDWDNGSSTGGQGTYDLGLMVSPTDKNTVYTGGVNIWGSMDGALTFNPVSYWVGYYGPSLHADQHFLTYQPLTGNYFVCNDGGIYRSTNLIAQSWSNAYNGNDWPTVWTNSSSGMAITSFYRVSSSQKNDGRLMAGAQDNSTFYFDGSSWSNIIGGDGMDNWIDKNDPYTLIGSSQYGNFEKSTDGGLNTNNLYITNEEGEWTTPIICDYTNGTLYTGFGNVFKSSNKGNFWKKISSFPVDANSGYLPEISAMAVASSNANVLYVTKRVRHEYSIKGACYTTTNGGTSWQDITAGLPDSLYFTSIEISSDNPSVAWVSCAGLSDGNKVFKTSDAGLNWQNISYNLPNLPVNVVKQLPGSNHKILIGTDIGVYFIDDSSYAWTIYSNGLPNVIVSDLEINAEANKIYASTFGRGIWESDLSDIVGVSPVLNEKSFTIYPSPIGIEKDFTIEIQDEYVGPIQLKIYDNMGRLCSQTRLEKLSSVFQTKLKAPSKVGVYWIEVIAGKTTLKKDLIVYK